MRVTPRDDQGEGSATGEPPRLQLGDHEADPRPGQDTDPRPGKAEGEEYGDERAEDDVAHGYAS